ncbi:hypothetical protein [Amycolatopsis sp. H20-H5]|uniref:hypothetical protein n=1 Tax=Amycolatopsis sp. H20-H5 TaxID=3046309 RepID=UPI002DB5E647|nr:hypothetical protein [Amycolatopsis sp. H20-H5]MEC3975807.1 hypothetical protein [Amycolatopsis sp. H20-H5]
MLIFLATAAHNSSNLGIVGIELVLGLVLGIAGLVLITLAWRLKVLTAEPRLQALGPLAIAVMLHAGCHLTHENPYLAAFAAGSTLATMDRVAAEHFEPLGDRPRTSVGRRGIRWLLTAPARVHRPVRTPHCRPDAHLDPVARQRIAVLAQPSRFPLVDDRLVRPGRRTVRDDRRVTTRRSPLPLKRAFGGS